MRLIDADRLVNDMAVILEQDVNLIVDQMAYEIENTIAEQPTIETIQGYRIEHLIWLARVMSKEGVTPEKLVKLLKDIGRIVDMVLSEQQEMFRRIMEEMIKNETD